MENIMKENSKKIKNMAKENLDGPIAESIKENG